MKKTVFTIITILLLHAAFAQTDSSSHTKLDSISTIVIHYMQAKQPDSIYSLAGENFKAHLSQESFKSVCENQVFPLNDFNNVTYITTLNGVSKYKVAGTPELQLLVGLDKDDKLETLLIQPFSAN